MFRIFLFIVLSFIRISSINANEVKDYEQYHLQVTTAEKLIDLLRHKNKGFFGYLHLEFSKNGLPNNHLKTTI